MNKPLFCAYYSAEAIIRHELADTFDAFRSEITQTLGDEARYSYFSEALMVHLAQRDLKQACQTIWGRYSRMTSLVFIPLKPWMYCLWHCEEGDNHSFISPENGKWADLQEQSGNTERTIPQPLIQRPLLLALWCVLCTPPRSYAGGLSSLWNLLRYECRRNGNRGHLLTPLKAEEEFDRVDGLVTQRIEATNNMVSAALVSRLITDRRRSSQEMKGPAYSTGAARALYIKGNGCNPLFWIATAA